MTRHDRMTSRLLTLTLSVAAAATPLACGDSGSATDTNIDTTTASTSAGTDATTGATTTGTSTSTASTTAESSATGTTAGATTTGGATETTTVETTESTSLGTTGVTTGLTDEPLEIAGQWSDGFGEHDITSELWTISFEGSNPSLFTIVWYDNEIDTLVAQNDAQNDFNPGLWSKFQWTYDGDDALWFCQVVFDAPTQADAEASPDADPSDPGAGGCGMFPWSPLTAL